MLDASERLARSLGLSTARIAPELDVDTAADLDRLRERLAAIEPGERPPHTAAALGFENARGVADGTEAGARSGGAP